MQSIINTETADRKSVSGFVTVFKTASGIYDPYQNLIRSDNLPNLRFTFQLHQLSGSHRLQSLHYWDADADLHKKHYLSGQNHIHESR